MKTKPPRKYRYKRRRFNEELDIFKCFKNIISKFSHSFTYFLTMPLTVASGERTF